MAKLRILVTRSPHQASELADGLRAAGMEPILIPAIELVPPTSFKALDAALSALDSFDWLIFTSANAVEAFAHRRVTVASAPANPFIAAIGPATARALTAIGLAPTLLPEKAVAESLAEALLLYARKPDGTPTRFLLVRAEQARDVVPETLRIAGASVEVVPVYRTVIPANSIVALRDLFASEANWPDAITFTSSSTANNLLELLRSAGLVLPGTIVRASIGPITTKTLQEAGYPPQIEATEATVASLIEALRLHQR